MQMLFRGVVVVVFLVSVIDAVQRDRELSEVPSRT